jgi:hypothetical protein
MISLRAHRCSFLLLLYDDSMRLHFQWWFRIEECLSQQCDFDPRNRLACRVTEAARLGALRDDVVPLAVGERFAAYSAALTDDDALSAHGKRVLRVAGKEVGDKCADLGTIVQHRLVRGRGVLAAQVQAVVGTMRAVVSALDAHLDRDEFFLVGHGWRLSDDDLDVPCKDDPHSDDIIIGTKWPCGNGGKFRHFLASHAALRRHFYLCIS